VDAASEMRPEQRDLLLLDAAEALRSGLGADPLVGRCGPSRFAILTAGRDPTELICGVQNAAERSSGTVAFQFGWARASQEAGLASLLSEAEKDLCENRLAYQVS